MFKDGKQVFSVGDIVEITEESDATGMLDFKKGKGYPVANISGWMVRVLNESGRDGWYSNGHFKLKEDVMDNGVEKKECLFKEGQVVWDVVYGKGVVVEIVERSTYPVVVRFSDETMAYTVDGKAYETYGRTLFFSEPKIEAATEPMFQPVLKEGDKLLTVGYDWQWELHEVSEELEYAVKNKQGTLFYKNAFAFYRLGEKIVFN